MKEKRGPSQRLLRSCYEEAKAVVCMFSLDISHVVVSIKTRRRPSPSAPGCLFGWKYRAGPGRRDREAEPRLLSSHPNRSRSFVSISYRSLRDAAELTLNSAPVS